PPSGYDFSFVRFAWPEIHAGDARRMSALDQLWVWDDPAIKDRLSWYLAVAENRKPAKFRIARTIPTALSLADASEDALWHELERLTPVFLERVLQIRETGEPLGPAASRPHLLDLCRELAQRMLGHCNFCRWNCRVDAARQRSSARANSP